MASRDLQLKLMGGASAPCNLNWRVEDGYLRFISWSEHGDPFTLGLCGPGDLIIPSLITIAPLQLVALSPARISESTPSPQERELFLIEQCLQTSTLVRLSRIRPAEARMFQLLFWIGTRFGRVSSRGISLSMDEMNLTHRHLGEISGLTRVTVTKAISYLRQKGYLQKEGLDDLLQPDAWPLLLQQEDGASSG